MGDRVATIYTDGASRGNPGAAAWAFIISRPGDDVVEVAEKLGSTTNNVAEYTALVKALERAKHLGIRRIELFSDSELLVKQMNGEYAVKSADLRGLYDEAQQLRRGFDAVQIRHVRRAQNKRADELCNLALDGHGGHKHEVTAKSKARAPVRDEAVDEQAVACLQLAADAWARSDKNAPTAIQVWDQLWSILDDANVLKKPKRR
ncbi:MAG: ribonuclease HI family protein [Gemmataceae bacterium]